MITVEERNEPSETGEASLLDCPQWTKKIKAAFFGDANRLRTVYGPEEEAILREKCNFIDAIIDKSNFDFWLDELRTVEVIFSTWTMPKLKDWHLDRLPSLRAVFFAAGSVRFFAEPLLARNILVVSAWKENAIPTSEFAFAQILLSMKGCFRNQREFCRPEDFATAYQGNGNFGDNVSLLGLGAIGSRVASLLKNCFVNVLAYDPYISRDHAEALGVRLVTLKEAFTSSFVVSNHIPLLPETRGLLTKGLFASMRKNATFINTARGAIVDEKGMIEVLECRPDIQALLDVTYPEPPDEGSPLYHLGNCYLTTHIAGTINHENRRLALACIREFDSWLKGEPLKHEVSLEQLRVMA